MISIHVPLKRFEARTRKLGDTRFESKANEFHVRPR